MAITLMFQKYPSNSGLKLKSPMSHLYLRQQLAGKHTFFFTHFNTKYKINKMFEEINIDCWPY